MGVMAFKGSQLDTMVGSYLAWRRHCESVRETYRAWAGAAREEKACRYAAYLEALDREQRACERYAAAVDRARA